MHRLHTLTWCQKVHCTAVLDGPCAHRIPAFMRFDFDRKRFAGGPSNCCDHSIPQHDDLDLVPQNPHKTTYGPNAFFCDPHRNNTLAAQYHYLPALARARTRFHLALENQSLKWLILVDDDSYVSVQQLVHILQDYDHQLPLYLGDFISSSFASSEFDLFACGGGGLIFSSAAVLRTQFASCHSAYRRSCLQSDWMIHGCVKMYDVTAVKKSGCHACADDSGGFALLHNLEKGCLSAQYEGLDFPFITNIKDAARRWHAMASLISLPAIVHLGEQVWEPGFNSTDLLLAKAEMVPEHNRTREALLVRQLMQDLWKSSKKPEDLGLPAHEVLPQQIAKYLALLNTRKCDHVAR